MKNFIAVSALAMSLQSGVMAEINSPQSARHVLSLNDVDITALIGVDSIVTGW